MIDQSLWRAGLNDPDYERIFNQVHNIIIHHSAGSNTDTDYTNVIRNIYIYHTEVRGWSDIGYNYLIAQDGTIFKGRDPGTLKQDEVLGAHFCNSNTGTLGICVMGSYSELAAPAISIQSLVDLITWKLGKDSIDPLGIYPHPLNQNLPVIAGHRDGCSTECPGDSIYYSLESIRNQVITKFDNCGYTIKPISIEQHPESEVQIHYVDGELIFDFEEPNSDSFRIFDLFGREYRAYIIHPASDRVNISTNHLASGIYFVVNINNTIKHTFKFVVY
jgi:hypothetical protein